MYHTNCPKCGSRDNVAVYDDGHGWCFGCRTIVIEPEHRLYTDKVKRRQSNGGYRDENKGSGNALEETGSTSFLALPSDYSLDIAVEGVQWLNKYQLTPREIQQNRIGWSAVGWTIRRNTPNPIEYKPLMISPVFDVYDNLLMYQARYFGSLKNVPKYWTVGNRGVLHTIGQGTTIALVEDIISAIKVGRYVTGVPIFGSDISTDLIIKIYNRFKDLVIWLDKDKRSYAHRRAQQVRYMFNSVRVIDSEVDPKEYSNEELKEYLNG